MLNNLSSLALIILALGLLSLSLFGKHGYVRLRELKQEVNLIKEKNESMAAEIAQTKNKIFSAEHSASTIERQAREELGLAKPGEIIYTFPDETSSGKKH